MPFVEVTGLVKSYSTGATRLEVLRGLDLAVERGGMIAIIGASGVGKSTLLHVLGGLDTFEAGSIRLGDAVMGDMNDQARVAFRNRNVGFVFQFHHLLPEFSALENVEMPLRIAGCAPAERRARAEDLLARVGLTARMSHRPGALSGGEQQRVAVARALVVRPSLLLADEPTGNLDEATARDLQHLLREMHVEHGLTSIIATHNPSFAASCDAIRRMADGRLV
jgi:lipoprotein-releasing system ATP-binding protein